MPSPHDEMRIKQLELLALGPVVHQWQPADGFHTLTVGEQVFKGRDLSELIIHAAAWVRAAQELAKEHP